MIVKTLDGTDKNNGKTWLEEKQDTKSPCLYLLNQSLYFYLYTIIIWTKHKFRSKSQFPFYVFFRHYVQTGYGSHTASCTSETSFGSVTMTTHVHLEQKFKMLNI